MKKINYFKLTLVTLLTTALFSSCLKDQRYIDFSAGGQTAELTNSGNAFFAQDAVTSDTAVIQFGVNIDAAKPLTVDSKITVGVDFSKVATYNAANPGIAYLQMPTAAYIFPTTVVDIPAGTYYKIISVTVYKNVLNPALSYMLPIEITSAPGLTIAGNQSIHYFHVIGNDFAGAYTWDYRRWQNGTGPGAGDIPSQGQGLPPDISSIGQAGTILPVSPTEFSMLTGYNGTGVMYDVKFTETPGTPTTYTGWSVTFNAANLALWAGAGITNMVPPAFTVPPPANSTQPKFFECNYVSGGASGRYIDDTYHH